MAPELMALAAMLVGLSGVLLATSAVSRAKDLERRIRKLDEASSE